jgi:hypothetical protein
VSLLRRCLCISAAAGPGALGAVACQPDVLDCYATATCPTAGSGGGGDGGATSSAGGSQAGGASSSAGGAQAGGAGGAGGAPGSCEKDADCAGAYCILEPPGCTTKKCGPKRAQGASCCSDPDASLHGCASSHCVDGVCCDGACTDLCASCKGASTDSGQDGVCSPVKKSTDPDDDCGAGLCLAQGSCGAVQVAAGSAHTCVVRGDGTVWCWGANNAGQLGVGMTSNKETVPLEVQALGPNAQHVCAGWEHSCALLKDGTVWCWGSSYYGQLGDGTKAAKSTPVKVQTLGASALAVSCGYTHTCALVAGGTLWCWGGSIQVDGTPDDKPTPVQLQSLGANVAAVAAGGNHTCALLKDGTVMCWGQNFAGQLGDGTTATQTAPVQVINIGANAVYLAAGRYHNCAILTGGPLWCWGDSQTQPAQVSVLGANVSGVSCGEKHRCALLKDATLSCWGDGTYGQLGDGTTMSKSMPVKVQGLPTGVAATAAGGAHTCAVLIDGTLWCWGGYTSSATTPVAVPGL